MTRRRALPFLVAVETDPLRYHGENPVRPEPLAPSQAEQLLAHVAADLTGLFPSLGSLGLCLAGALYDQAQVLRPGWPLFKAMEDVANRRWKRESDRSTLMSIGASGGRMPVPELIPDPQLPPGVLHLLPLQLHGDGTTLHRLETEMEHRFMEEGQLSALSARALENAFQVTTTHVRLLTLTDLRAMLKHQLDHFGFPVLWTLLDAALEAEEAPVAVRGNAGQRLRWTGDSVHARFETFDHWAREGAGKDQPADALAAGYAAWTREYRQLLVTLGAHGVTVRQYLPGDSRALEGLFLEETAGRASDGAPAITEHQGAGLGTVAVTVTASGRMTHYYPLAPEGSNALHAHIAALGLARQGLSYPGTLCHDPQARRLVADCPPALPP